MRVQGLRLRVIVLEVILLSFAGFPFPAGAAGPSLPDLSPVVSSLYPAGGRPGETLQIDMSGRRLDGTLEVAFNRPDIKGELISSNFNTAKVKVTVGSTVPTGLHDYRLKTPNGAFVGVFHVGSLPGGREVEPNDDVRKPQKITLPAMMEGNIGGPDFDVYSFHAEEGQTLIFDLLGRRAGSTLDANLGLLDERGNELDFSEDYYIHKDPQLTFSVKRTGDYFIRVGGQGEGRRGGGGAASYRLLAGAFPLIRRVLPVGARRGAATELRAAGVNLAGVDRVVLGDGLAEGKVVAATAELITVRLHVPASVPPGRYTLHAFAGKMEAPLPVPLIVSDLDEKLSTPARRRAEPQPVQASAAYSGVLDRRRDAHFFSLDVRAGERLVFDVDAMKLGYLVDPIVAIYSLEGELIASDDDRLQQNGKQVPNLDPYLVYTFEKAGRFILMIRDLAERGDPNYVYRLAIYPAEPDFDLKIMVPTITLYRGQTVELPVRVRRHGGWDTPVDVWVENPPAAISNEKQTAEPKPTIVTDDCSLERRLDGTDVHVPIRVAADAALGSYTLRLRARGVWSGRTVEHGGEVQYKWESVGKVSGPIEDQKLVATITDLPPVLLEPPESLTLTLGKAARFRVLVTRFDGGKTPLTVEPEMPLAGVEFGNNVLEPGASQIEMRVTASDRIKPGTFRLKAGPGISPAITLRVGSSEDVDQ
jgi:quinohemoprotein amine dehydrogenase alpha subunit-like protein